MVTFTHSILPPAGEVSTECPYLSSSKYLRRQAQAEQKLQSDLDFEHGTGCLVYDTENTDLDELFSLLDTGGSPMSEKKIDEGKERWEEK